MDFDFTNETITPDSTNVLTIGGSGGIEFPAGTTAERPLSPINGNIRYNTDNLQFEVYVHDEWIDLVDGSSSRFIEAETLIVQKTPAPGQFSSVATALASITDNSITKPYIIKVSAGVFVEPQLVMKEYVNIIGASMTSTVLEALDDNDDFIIAIRNAGISALSISGPNAIGNSAIYHDESSGDIQNSFIAFNINFRDCYQFVSCLRGSIQLTNILIGGAYSFTRGFESVNSTTGSRLVIRNLFSTRLTQPYPEFLIKVDGSNAFLVATALFNRARGSNVSPTIPAGTGLWIKDGATVRMQSASILGYDKGIWIENAGSASEAYFNGVFLESNIEDLVVDHPSAMGSFDGTLSVSGSSSQSDTFELSILDTNGGGSYFTGSLNIGRSLDTVTDVTDLIQLTTSVGLLDGAVLTQGTGALEVDISEGFGYIQDPTQDNRSTRVTWPNTTLTIPNNSFKFIYYTPSGFVLSAAPMSNPFTNISVGVVQTRSGALYQLIDTRYDSVHEPTKIDDYIRRIIGFIVESGIEISAGTGLTLNATSGRVFYSTRVFYADGGTGITLYPYYRVSGVWTPGSTISTVPVDQWDDGTDLVSLTSGYWARHTIYVSTNVISTAYKLVYSQAEYATKQEAIDDTTAPVPPLPNSHVWVPLAYVIVQEGASTIDTVIDVRPQINKSRAISSGSSGGGGGGVTDHGLLTGLSDDDHTQYLLTDGSRAMTGTLDLGLNNISNAGTINSVNIQTHGTRHNPNGADPISTAIAVELSPSSVNSAGSANSLARSDHVHRIDGFQPVDSDLTAISDLSTTGIAIRTSPTSWTTRSITSGSGISVTNGDGISGDISVSNTGVLSLAVTQPASGITVTNSGVVQTGAVSTTISLANDLAALENLSSTGFASRTTADTWATRTITGTTNTITVTNGNGVAGNPTITIADNPILPGTGSLTFVSGTTAQRPVSPTNGMIRYNTTLGYTEIYQGGVWYKLGYTTQGGTSILQVYTGAVPTFNTNTQVPFDNTVPLVTEGDQVWSRTITPTTTGSTLKFTIPFTIDISANNQASIISIFRGSTNIGSAVQYSTGGGRPTTLTVSVQDSPATLSPVTYSMRVGAQGATVYINSTSSGNNLGGALLSTYEIIEVV